MCALNKLKLLLERAVLACRNSYGLENKVLKWVSDKGLRWNILWFGRKQMIGKNTWFWNEWDILLANCRTLRVSLKSFSVSRDRARPDVLNFSFRRLFIVLKTASNCKYLQSLQSISIERICTNMFVRNSCRAYTTQVNSVFGVHWLAN